MEKISELTHSSRLEKISNFLPQKKRYAESNTAGHPSKQRKQKMKISVQNQNFNYFENCDHVTILLTTEHWSCNQIFKNIARLFFREVPLGNPYQKVEVSILTGDWAIRYQVQQVSRMRGRHSRRAFSQVQHWTEVVFTNAKSRIINSGLY